MPGKTISMHTNGETARLMESLARVEDRSPSQIASAALSFYLRLPPEAHNALRHVLALGTEEDAHRVTREITRLLLNVQYDIAVRRLGEELRAEGGAAPETEEQMLEEAASLIAADARHTPSSRSTRSRVRKTG